MKPSASALAVIDGKDKLLQAEKVGATMLDPQSARGDTRRIEDLKRIWKQKEAVAPYTDRKSQATDTQSNLLMISKREKNEDDLRQRLRTSWRKIYRTIKRVDEARTGQIRMSDFMDALHQNDCFVSNEELLKMQRKYGNTLYKGNDPHDK